MTARRRLIEEEAKRRCLAGGYTLETPARALTSFSHREGPLWKAFVPKVEAEIERIEEAGFEVLPRDRFAEAAEETADARESAVFSLVGMLVLIFILALWLWGRR